MPKYQEDQRVRFRGRRGNPATGVITGVRWRNCRKRPGYYEYEILPDGEEGYWRVGESLITKVLGKVRKKKAEAASKKVDGIKDDISETKRKRKEHDRELIRKMQIEEGDEILIRGRGCNDWFATAVRINYQTGKVGIKNRNYDASYKDPFQAALAGALGMRRGKPREFRWIAGNCIIENRTKEIRFDADEKKKRKKRKKKVARK